MDTRQIIKVAENPFQKMNDKDILKYLTIANDNKKPLSDKGRWLFRSELDKLAINFKTKKEQNK
jgi:hypothetical protein